MRLALIFNDPEVCQVMGQYNEQHVTLFRLNRNREILLNPDMRHGHYAELCDLVFLMLRSEWLINLSFSVTDTLILRIYRDGRMLLFTKQGAQLQADMGLRFWRSTPSGRKKD